PVVALTELVQQVQKGRRSTIEPIRTGDELEDLSLAFSQMSDELANRQQRLEHINASLTLEKDRHSTVLHSLTSGVFATDKDGLIILFNKAAESITGLKAKALLGRPVDAALQLYADEELIGIE